MIDTRQSLLHSLEDLKEQAGTLDKNNKKIARLEEKMFKRTKGNLRMLFMLITLGPLFILYFIESRRVPVLDELLFVILPNIIPGFSLFFRVFVIGLVILFFYSMLTVGKESSYLRQLGFLERVVVKIQSGFHEKIVRLKGENNNILNACNLGNLPPKYRNSRAIDKIYGYLINLRADNLTEAINLYEFDDQQMRQAMAESLALSDMKRSMKETERAAQSAERMAVEAKNSLGRRRV
ncbi:hypothetical protein [Evansella clarkii]|uniref:hypothetical protein n=1 Tax=Evansella clarkii TaxID=79879 RepID=UPI00099891BF|nr:hypothetical protein [Evansella clarkii]